MCVVCNNCGGVMMCKTGRVLAEKEFFGYECKVDLRLIAQCVRCQG